MAAFRTRVVRSIPALRDTVARWRRNGESVGLVPTMGALHAGHIELVRQSRAQCDRTVVSIFVNPTQFNPDEDLDRYPRQEEKDLKVLSDVRADLAFIPVVEEIYPEGFATAVHVGRVTTGMEGTVRVGHFDGVATVVCKLFMQATPDKAFFGEKDYQQLTTIRHMARDLDMPVTVVPVPTVREADGLALSSRNAYLSPEQRRIAASLNRILRETARSIAKGRAIDAATAAARQALLDAGFDAVDYVECRAEADLAVLETLDRPARVLATARLGPTRLLDNVSV
ncbi:MAG: pantoate--beta-alanine ligase [Rhodospirillaceae bacterium]|nr:pantoate--beta-alanine ligase [Rhodospirillaceae bacterium]